MLASVARPADLLKRNAGLRLAAFAFDLEPAVAAIEALRDRGGWLGRSTVAFIRIDQASAAAAWASRTA